jgi:hypothetical protein
VKEEAARIIIKYRQQVLTYSGEDVAELQVVKDARQFTNHAARDDARRYERRAKSQGEVAKRLCDAAGDKLAFSWGKDPDFGELLNGVKKLPGREYDGMRKRNVVDVTDEAEIFAVTWDFKVTEAAEALLRGPRKEFFNITAKGTRIQLETLSGQFSYDMLPHIQALPGRAYGGGNINTCDASMAVLDLAHRFNLTITEEAIALCKGAEAALKARKADEVTVQGIQAVMAQVSRSEGPSDLPEVFENMLLEILGPGEWQS